ncbi:MAG: ROK family protein [Chthonomonadales bacterium]
MYVGLDIGGTKCAAILADEKGEIVGRTELATDGEVPAEAFVFELIGKQKKLIKQHKVDPKSIAGIGISCGGPLDRKAGVILRPPNLPKWEAVPIKKIVEENFPGIPVFVENDANATALAEWKFGAGRGVNTMAFVTMGTGVGAGLILDGKLYHGTNDMAGEVGHQTILIDGPKCGCGKRGCLEALVSGPAIGRMAQERLEFGRGKRMVELAGGKATNVTAKHVVEAAREGDALAITIINDVGTYLGMGLANLIMIINPERIVLGTIAVHAGDLLLNPTGVALREFAWPRSLEVCEVVPAELGDRAQDLAAIVLPMIGDE